MNYAISNEYQDECIQCPTTEEDWRAISSEFNYRWNVPHACGALDGKHVACKRPQIKYFDSNITCNLAAGINLERQHLIQTIFSFINFHQFNYKHPLISFSPTDVNATSFKHFKSKTVIKNSRTHNGLWYGLKLINPDEHVAWKDPGVFVMVAK